MFITKIGSHPIILGKPWINRHKVIIDGKDDSIHFKPGRCDHARLTPRPKPSKTMPPRELWLPPPPKPKETSPPASPQKYKILQRRETPPAPKQVPPRPTVEDSDEEEESQKETIATDAPWPLIPASELSSLTDTEEEDKPKTPKKSLAERRAAKIAKHQNSKVILESPSRRPVRPKRPKLPPPPPEPGDARGDDSPLDIGMIGAAAFHKQASKTGRKRPEMFSMTLQQIRSTIAKTKESPEQAPNSASNPLKISNVEMKELIRKCPEFLRKFKSVLNPKEAESLPAHDPYDHKIELTDDPATLPKSKVYSLSPKK